MNLLKFLGKGLISNEVIIKKSKEKKLWFSLLVMIISIIVSITPVFTSLVNVKGSNVLNDTSLQLDYSLQRFTHEYLSPTNAKLKMFVDENGQLQFGETSFAKLENAKQVTLKNGEPLSFIEIKQNEKITLLVTYFSYDENKESTTYSSLSEKADDVFKHLETHEDYKMKKENENDKDKYEIHSTFIFSNESYIVRLFKNGSTCEATKENNEVMLNSTPKNETSISGIYRFLNERNLDLNAYDNQNPETIISKWSSFFNETYEPIKKNSLLVNTSVYAGINLVIVFLLSFTLFIMTLFKSSSCGKQKFGYCFKVMSFASLSPALICLLVGFMIPSFQSMAFLMFFGLRGIFLSTKLTRMEELKEPVKVKKVKK